MNRAYRHAEKSDLLGAAWSGRAVKRCNHRVLLIESMITKGSFEDLALQRSYVGHGPYISFLFHCAQRVYRRQATAEPKTRR